MWWIPSLAGPVTVGEKKINPASQARWLREERCTILPEEGLCLLCKQGLGTVERQLPLVCDKLWIYTKQESSGIQSCKSYVNQG